MKIDRGLVGLVCFILIIIYFTANSGTDEVYKEHMLRDCEIRTEYGREVTVCG